MWTEAQRPQNCALFSCSQVLLKAAANPVYPHPYGRFPAQSTPRPAKCHHLLDPQHMSTQLCPQAALGPEQSGKGRLGCTEDGAARAVSQQGSLLQNLPSVVGSVQCLVGLAEGPAKGWHCTRHSRHKAAGVRQCLTTLLKPQLAPAAPETSGSGAARPLSSSLWEQSWHWCSGFYFQG